MNLIHLALKVSRTEFICGPIRCTVDFSCWLLHSEIILLNQTLQTALCNKAVFKYFFKGKIIDLNLYFQQCHFYRFSTSTYLSGITYITYASHLSDLSYSIPCQEFVHLFQ
jgi:hypothetical protein